MTPAARRLVASFDPRSPEFLADPYPTYEALRQHSPFHRWRTGGDCYVARYEDVVAVLKDQQFGFEFPVTPEVQNSSALVAAIADAMRVLSCWLIFKNGTEHTRIWRVIQGAFHSAHAARVLASVQARTDALIDRVLEQGEMDAIHDFSAPLTGGIITDLLGIPEDEREEYLRLADDAHLIFDLESPFSSRARGLMALHGLDVRFRKLFDRIEQASATPDHVIGALLRARREGHLTADELLAQCGLLIIAGQVNSKLLIATSLLALLRHPDQLNLLRAQPELLETGIHELVRYDTPTQVVSRVALNDVRLGDTVIRKGEPVRLLVASANRDAAVFQDPDRLDIRRNPNPHLSFGHGLHYCLGAALGKLEVQTAVGTILRRIPRFRLESDQVEWTDAFVIRALKSLPIVFE